LRHKSFMLAIKTGVVAAALAVIGISMIPSSGKADNDQNAVTDEKQMIQIGLKTAPVTLTFGDRDPDLIGLGSYLVNYASDCNGCHTSDPSIEYTGPGNPALLPPPSGPYAGGTAVVNPAAYLGGGQDFGAFPSPNNSVHILSRNITPDKTGMPAGGMTLAQFMQVMKSGNDMDLVHPNCDATHKTNCLTPPFNGALLQVMPWPRFQNMTDRQIIAIYNYLSAIPCLEGGPGEPASRCK
jgi:mono/diheme cytochrome c family protein